ncbi:MAG TPA: glycosyltransferase family 39 protein [Candidatus Obscuribacterales bacterium]
MYKQSRAIGLKFAVSLELLLLLAIAIAVLLRLLNLGSREFWYDEVLSLLLSTGQRGDYQNPGALPVAVQDYTSLLYLPSNVAGYSAIEAVKNVIKGILSDPHPPLFYLSLHGWLYLFGNSEIALRSLVAFLSIAAIGCAYGLGRTLLGHRGGLILAALLSVNPFYLSHSLNVRMYGPLVLWTTLSAWALLRLIHQDDRQLPQRWKQSLSWYLLLIGSVTAGLLTQYLFVYWVVTLAALVLYLDWRRWWQYAIPLTTGVILTIPWAVWGTLQQLRNRSDVVRQVSGGGGTAAIAHLQDVTQTLAAHLLLGDWLTSLPTISIVLAGVGVIAVLIACVVSVWRSGKHQLLGTAFILGIFPLLLALAVDTLTGKLTIGFGWGRAMIFILPGCLLLLTLGLERLSARWQGPAVAALLLLYLSVGVSDFSLRQRQVFHAVTDLVMQEPTTPTLIAMNSSAWGHVLRLAYYMPPSAPVQLLAQKSADLTAALATTLTSETASYPRILWIDSARPVWSRPSTELEKQQVQQVLDQQYRQTQTHHLTGTMLLDEFTVRLYTRSSAT